MYCINRELWQETYGTLSGWGKNALVYSEWLYLRDEMCYFGDDIWIKEHMGEEVEDVLSM